MNERIQTAQLEVTGQVQKVENEVLAQKVVITFPTEGSTVHLTDLVRGRTPFLDKDTYVLITPMQTGVTFVQDGPVKADRDGSWATEVRLAAAKLELERDL